MSEIESVSTVANYAVPWSWVCTKRRMKGGTHRAFLYNFDFKQALEFFVVPVRGRLQLNVSSGVVSRGGLGRRYWWGETTKGGREERERVASGRTHEARLWRVWPLSYDLNTAISALSGAMFFFLSFSLSLSPFPRRWDAISPPRLLSWGFTPVLPARASREILFN